MNTPPTRSRPAPPLLPPDSAEPEVITPQTLIRGRNEPSWTPAPPLIAPLPSVVTERYFALPAMKTAPAPVRWAYGLSWFWLTYLSLALFMMVWNPPHSSNLDGLAIYSALWGTTLWSNRGLRRGTRAGWRLQIPLSVLGLFGLCCLGTPFHGYVLTKWFSPEVKGWFDLH